MNVRIKKEMRMLKGPFLLNAISAPTVALFFDGRDGSGFSVVVFASFCALMAAISFGSEFDGKTILTLLSQPVSRRQIWFEKMSVLAGALVASYAVTLLSIAIFSQGAARPERFADLCAIMLLGVIFSFCSGPAISLGVKNLTVSVPIIFFTPLTLWGCLFFVCWAGSFLTSHPDVPIFQDQFQNHPYVSIGIPSIIYCAFFYWLGTRAMAGLQAIDSQSQELKLPTAVESALGRPLKRFLPSYTGPIASLFRKELQIQRVSFLGAAFICIVLPIEAIVWKLHNSDITGGIMITEMVLYALMIPIITGVVTTAEERNMGTSGWQLTLPASPLKQWSVKIFVASAVVIGLGLMLPFALLMAGKWIFGMPISSPLHGGWDHVIASLYLLGYLTLFGLIVFASSVSVNSLRALTFCCGLLIASGTIIGLESQTAHYAVHRWVDSNASHMPRLHELLEWWGKRFYLNPDEFLVAVMAGVTIVTLIAVLYISGCMAFSNFRNGELDTRRIWKQSARLVLCIVIPSVALVIMGNLANSF